MELKESRTAVVTGGSRGIGRQIVTDLLDDGWTVLSVQRGTPDAGHERVQNIVADLSTSSGIDACIDGVRSRITRLDLLVNNAGEIHADEDLMTVTEDTMLSSWRLHTLAPLLLARALKDLLQRSPGPAVVNIGSVYGTVPDPEVLAYGSSKCGLGYVTSALAAALAPAVRVNAVLPGHVDTDMTQSAPAEFQDMIRGKTPLKRFATAREVSKAVRFLGGDDSSFITGTSLVVDGGFLLTR
jgi:3-oxoacyl-[acyl-carrier protein] reductase